MPPAELTLRAINRATLARQMLLARASRSAVDAIQHLLALQAQVARPPFLALWSRVASFARADLASLLTSRKVVRGTTMRGTIHVMSAADFMRFRVCLQPGLDAATAAILKSRAAGLDVPTLLKIGRSFFDTPRTFDALRDHLDGRFPGGEVRAMAYVIRMTLPLVQIPTDAAWAFPAQAEFIAAEKWLGKAPGPCASSSSLVERYLAAYGPASVKDMQSWLGLRVQEDVDAIRGRLVALKGPGRAELFDVPDAPRPPEDTAAPVRFLPDFDSAIVCRADERFVAKAHRAAVFLPGLRIAPTLLIDGVVAGTWAIARKKATATLTLSAFRIPPPKLRNLVEEEGEALLRFAEPDATAIEVMWSAA